MTDSSFLERIKEFCAMIEKFHLYLFGECRQIFK